MSPIEQELSEWDRALAEDTNAFRTVVTKFGHKDSADFVNKLISFIRHQQEVIAAKNEALMLGWNAHCLTENSLKKALAIKTRESLEGEE